MRPQVLCVYVDGRGKKRGWLRAETEAALARHAKGADVRYDVVHAVDSLHDTSYANILAAEWEAARGVIIVEPDIVIRAGIIKELWSCPEPWCGFPYTVGGTPNGRMLGCTKFSAELMRAEPSAMMSAAAIRFNTGCMPGCWHRMDGAILETLEGRGYTFHEHLPPVEHLHNYSGVPDADD